MFKLFVILFFVKICVNGVPLENAENNYKQVFSNRILGGNPAPQEYVPHMAALMAGEGFTLIACGGTIVNSKLIMTAAECIEYFLGPEGLHPTFHAVVGATNWVRGLIVHFKGYHIHPEWNSFNHKNNIGFLVLLERLVMSETMRPASMNFDQRVDGGVSSYVAGWGIMQFWPAVLPSQLKILDTNTITSELCVAKLKQMAHYYVDPSIEICTFHSIGSGLCYGDAGGGLISRESGLLIGIASWTIGCAGGHPDMFTRISAYKDYIQFMLKKYE